jgi:hypothetical protein
MGTRALIVLLGVMLITGATRARETPNTDMEYVQALAVANTFLGAWVTRDTETGLRLLSDAVRKSSMRESQVDREAALRQFLSGLSNPHHQAFEVGRGRRSDSGTFVFPVTLYEYANGMSSAFSYRSEIELVNERGQWVINRLPRTSDNK